MAEQQRVPSDAYIQEYGFCLEPALPGRVDGDFCTADEAGMRCATDDTVCVALPNVGYRCARLCKKGIPSTCAPVPGSEIPRICREDLAFQPPAPQYLSICDDAF